MRNKKKNPRRDICTLFTLFFVGSVRSVFFLSFFTNGIINWLCFFFLCSLCPVRFAPFALPRSLCMLISLFFFFFWVFFFCF